MTCAAGGASHTRYIPEKTQCAGILQRIHHKKKHPRQQ